MKSWIALVARFVVIFLAIATLVSLVAADAWWIRVFDFPRLQIAFLLALAIVVLFVTQSRRLLVWVPVPLLAMAFQVGQVLPYFSFMPKEAVDADQCAATDRLHIASLNVLQDNTDYRSPSVRSRREPGHLPRDGKRCRVDRCAFGRAGCRLSLFDEDPQPNTYGMAMWSRLPFAEMERNELAGGGTPSIKARVQRADGGVLTLFAVHPRPPRPGQEAASATPNSCCWQTLCAIRVGPRWSSGISTMLAGPA